jgi:hypothetical protein
LFLFINQLTSLEVSFQTHMTHSTAKWWQLHFRFNSTWHKCKLSGVWIACNSWPKAMFTLTLKSFSKRFP